VLTKVGKDVTMRRQDVSKGGREVATGGINSALTTMLWLLFHFELLASRASLLAHSEFDVFNPRFYCKIFLKCARGY
jgi:hypothetical protein